MKKYLLWMGVIILTFLYTFLIPSMPSTAQDGEPPQTQVSQQVANDQIEQAILNAIAANSRYENAKSVPNLQVTDIVISQDQDWGIAWVVYYDPAIEAVIPSEPAPVVVHREGEVWKVYLPSDQGWQSSVYAVPDELLSKDTKDMWVAMDQGTPKSLPAQGGYYLPWHGGQTASLSRSIGHDADFSTSHYAFDFYKPGTTVCPGGGKSSSGTEGLNFEIYAAKAGTVWGWEDSVDNCNHTDVNFLVIRNNDDPSIFQLYMHLAKGSIPSALKTVGAPIGRGQLIAIADNTGISTGSHLHFQVEHQPTWPADNPYWNTSLDMTFDDVSINGGRPRVSPADPPYCRSGDACDVFQQTYLSNNFFQGDSIPPTGELSGITTGETITEESITLNGWGDDNESGLAFGQIRAYFNDSWHNIGQQFNPSINYSWDLCDANLPVADGAVSVALQLYDLAGNSAPLVGLNHFIKDYACPSPPTVCLPGQDEITLFEDPNYHGGCVRFGLGNYLNGNSLNPLGNNDAESILVGEDAIATFYSEENFSGHSQSFINNTALLKYQWVDENSLSSMRVSSRREIPRPPLPVSPIEATAFRDGDIIPISWVNSGGAEEFRYEIYLNGTLSVSSGWQSEPEKFIDSLSKGNYTWRVKGRNEAGESDWSALASFSIESPIVFPPVETLPYSDTMESTQSDWTPGGIWSYKNDSSIAHSGSHSWWYATQYGNYDTNGSNTGSLTSPPFSIQQSGYYLRFYYRTETESHSNKWDQRWLQISIDGGPFTNLVQFAHDAQIPETSSWMKNRAINLSEYTGHVIRIRYNFTTLDGSANNFAGWGIDDFSITAVPPQNCSDSRQDDTPGQAYLLNYDPTLTISGDICPNGDLDYYRFYGNAGDQIVADIDAMDNGSPLDTYLYLLDSDGKTVLAENDDEVYAELRDPLLTHKLNKTGIYYLRLQAWKHPLVGGDDYSYTVRFYEDHTEPTASITWPATNAYLPDHVMTVNADIADPGGIINRVEYYWHSTDWLTSEWEHLGTDRDGADGWSFVFDPAGQQEGNNAAFMIEAFDKAGNHSSVGAWNLVIDKAPPVTNMLPLAPTQPSNAFLLEWSASDNLSGIDYFDFQESVNNGKWAMLPPLDGANSSFWVISNPGNNYAYMMRGVDNSGNTENFPPSAEVSTAIPNAGVLCYTPDIYDTNRNDNSPANASTIIPNGLSQFHNYCNPLRADFQQDEDWVRMDVIQGERYFIHSIANSLPTVTEISLFADDGTTLIAKSSPPGFGSNTFLMWTPDHDQTVYLRLRHLDGRVIGTQVSSTVVVKTGFISFIPIINK